MHVEINPHPDAWTTYAPFDAASITGATLTMSLFPTGTVMPPGALRLRTSGAVAGDKFLTIYFKADTERGGY